MIPVLYLGGTVNDWPWAIESVVGVVFAGLRHSGKNLVPRDAKPAWKAVRRTAVAAEAAENDRHVNESSEDLQRRRGLGWGRFASERGVHSGTCGGVPDAFQFRGRPGRVAPSFDSAVDWRCENMTESTIRLSRFKYSLL